MQTQVRQGVFETNSSSTHSLTISESTDLLSKPFIGEKVELNAGEYGWEFETYDSPIGKAEYLFTDALMGPGCEKFPMSCDKVQMLVRAIEEHAGVEVLIGSTDGYIDHQSVGICDEVWAGGIESVKNFIFNPGCIIETGNDNV
jgi:hypothetical protein